MILSDMQTTRREATNKVVGVAGYKNKNIAGVLKHKKS